MNTVDSKTIWNDVFFFLNGARFTGYLEFSTTLYKYNSLAAGGIFLYDDIRWTLDDCSAFSCFRFGSVYSYDCLDIILYNIYEICQT